MAISKKGFRKIIVTGSEFYWKFKGKVFVTTDTIENNLLIIDFGWYDVWWFVNDKENEPPDFEPKIVTPKFVSESILFALREGWKEGELEIKFENGSYKKILNL